MTSFDSFLRIFLFSEIRLTWLTNERTNPLPPRRAGGPLGEALRAVAPRGRGRGEDCAAEEFSHFRRRNLIRRMFGGRGFTVVLKVILGFRRLSISQRVLAAIYENRIKAS